MTSIAGNGRGTARIRPHHPEDLCVVAPDPELKDRLNEQFEQLRSQAGALLAPGLRYTEPTHPGFNDGLLFPGTYYPVGTPLEVARRAALERAPLRGTVRVIVVLVEFSDRSMASGAAARLEELFFSTGVLGNGSVKEYFTDVSGGLVTLTGDVVGPYLMPQTIATYAGSGNGTQAAMPNARTMANDAVTAADPNVNFAPYDNDGNGYVDAFLVVHAGSGAEQTGAATDIWSHKWVLPAERSVDGSKVYTYLTIPEDAKIGVCAHELGHLLFGWPDLYDTDYSSEGVGNWCLMGGGSWGLGGDRPTHPSAWCKVNQEWANVVAPTSNASVSIDEVKTSRTVYRLWKDGAGGNEYFLVENRMQTGYDASLPGQGLLIWHIDDATANNRDETHYKVALEQADGSKDLENARNRGDGGDPYPGSSGNSSFTDLSTPNSKSYAGASTCVSVTGIPAAAPSMPVRLTVRCFVKPPKDFKDGTKELRKEITEKPLKDRVEGKGLRVEKPRVEKPRVEKPLADKPVLKEAGPKELKEIREGPFGTEPGGSDVAARLAALESAVAALLAGQGLEQPGSAGTGVSLPPGSEPFIGPADRPDLSGGGQGGDDDAADLRAAMESGAPGAKRAYDALPPR